MYQIKFSIIALLFCLHTAILSGQNGHPKIKGLNGSHVTASALDERVLQIMDSLEMPGLSIAVINDSKTVYHRAFGVANMDTKEPVTEQTIFEGASLSKPVFAYFAMKMVQKGLLDLDKPMYEYIPHPGVDSSSQDYYKLITPRIILSHSSGFPNWSHGEMIKLEQKPGTNFSYSGEAYQYLAAVIGQLNGVGFKDDLNQIFLDEVATPLGLQNTSFTWNDYIEEHKAMGHQEGKTTDKAHQGKAFGAGYSIHSNAQDYAKFLIALIKQEGLEEKYFKEMFTEHTHFKDDNPIKVEVGQTGWGLGMAQKPDEKGMMHMHTGNNHDFQSYCMILPDEEYGIVFFTNSDKMEGFLESFNILGKQF
ncbi:beta-lactamase family protein [Marivirga sp. S37H4]|uniref:Beta-lactamase family protein n=1 Tax=Marivirga aurantiaca TaxID=2802615 RepID=A0A934WYQ1_9BACT|nr:serine hydrolase domain-containing protein [Marivirga aurantiaca]MBK6265638.1 beta-lactamase family protein [Marivirga aurantiaca]